MDVRTMDKSKDSRGFLWHREIRVLETAAG